MKMGDLMDMTIKRKKAMSTEDIAKDMNHLILVFGDEGVDKMKSMIITHLTFMGWDKNKAAAYAELVKIYASIRGDIASVWGKNL